MIYNRRTFTFVDPWNGDKMDAYFEFGKYWFNDRIAIQLYAKSQKEKEDFFEPYCSVTVNLPSAKMDADNLVFVDVNNAPWLEGLLAENGFGLPTGRFRTSGFVNYPEYLLNLDRMKKYTCQR